MKNVLIFAAVAEAATGLALLIVPSLVGQLLLGEDLTGVAIPVARVTGIALIALGIACWPGPPLVGMLTYSAVVTLYLAYLGFAGGFDRRLSVAGCRPARAPDGALDSRSNPTAIDRVKKTQAGYRVPLSAHLEQIAQNEPMSALGQKQTSRDARVTSALTPIADIRWMSWHVRLVPLADIQRGRYGDDCCDISPSIC